MIQRLTPDQLQKGHFAFALYPLVVFYRITKLKVTSLIDYNTLLLQVYHALDDAVSYSNAKAYIEKLPTADSPELLGMNENSEHAYLESQASELTSTILSVQPRLSSSLIGYFP